MTVLQAFMLGAVSGLLCSAWITHPKRQKNAQERPPAQARQGSMQDVQREEDDPRSGKALPENSLPGM